MEINIGIICTCLPVMRLVLVRLWPRIFSSKASSDNFTPTLETIALTAVLTNNSGTEPTRPGTEDKQSEANHGSYAASSTHEKI